MEELNKSFVEILSSPYFMESDRNVQEFLHRFKKKNELSQNKILAQYNDIWQSIPLVQNDYNSEEAFNQINNQLNSRKTYNNIYTFSRKRYFIISTLAAAVFIPILFFTLSYIKQSAHTKNITYSEYHVPYGSRSKITLPDGTKVWINAGSTLKYP